ncbi:MAG: primosomal protein N' [Planctomycetota bacterium]|nr:primosomal protein N' [Planctomycetota bacterium]
MTADLFSKPVELSGLYARVVLERGIDQPEGLTYAVPASLADLMLGERVRAPLGRGDTPTEGYVIALGALREVAEEGMAARVKPLLGRAARSASSGAPRFPPTLIQLAQWMAGYYCCPIGMVLATMIPAGVKRQTGSVDRPLLALGTDPQGEAREAVLKALGPSGRRAWEKLAGLTGVSFPVEARALADLLSERTVGPVNRLVDAGILRRVVRADVRVGSSLSWDEPGLHGGTSGPPPTEAQEQAVRTVAASGGSFAPFLLFGVTGSGKTEVYLRVLRGVIDAGRSAIVLVPEISLTPQTAGRFVARFADLPSGSIAVLHSGLTEAQRHEAWSRAASGRARIVIGARSAVFAPFPAEAGGAGSLGLIIVDEEHDSSYKQDQLPRYHARDVALRRGQLERCPVVLGSATPSLESWHNARSGRFGLLRLPERVGGGAMPPVHVVNMVDEQRAHREAGSRRLHALGPRLEREVRGALDRGGQIMLLLNRRGYASYVCCADATCGWFLTCRHCDVTAVYHRERGAAGAAALHIVKCHHCGAEQRLPTLCPACGKTVNTFGFGTQRVEDELAEKFPELRIDRTMLRLDSDSMRRAADYFRSLERFREGSVRLLLGTQMIAKGLDFPGVDLIGVINADTALALPDFRAEERTFQLLAQVAGRAGRSAATGVTARVIVQTFNPGVASIRRAAAHDFEGFAADELVSREEAGLPPTSRMARIVCRDVDGAKAERRAHEVALAAREEAAGPGLDVRVRGPMECAIKRVGDHYRFAVEMLSATAGPLQRVLSGLRSAGLVRSDAHTAVDVDPVALL